MLFTISIVLLLTWTLGVVGVYDIGSLVHVLLLVGLMLSLLVFAKARDKAAARDRASRAERR